MIEEILEQRNRIHGDFTKDAATAQAIKCIYHDSPNFAKLSPVQREALDHIATKIARILVGNANHQDHWDDIAGYAKLVSQRLSPPLAVQDAPAEPGSVHYVKNLNDAKAMAQKLMPKK